MSEENTEIAVFAAGCFWGVEQEFRRLKGVLTTEVGYTGGKPNNPTYHNVCGGETGHAEAIRIAFDPAVISYERLVAVFFTIHNPTQVGGQGVDMGEQYRSAVFFHSPEQEATATEFKKNLDASNRFAAPITTQIFAATEWWPAEEHHQQYFEKQGRV